MPDDPKESAPRVVLDASALLVYLQRERGHLLVEPVLGAAAISAVNLSEVLQKSAAAGVPTAACTPICRRLVCGSTPSIPKTRHVPLTYGPARASLDCLLAIGPAWRWPNGFAFPPTRLTARGPRSRRLALSCAPSGSV